MRADLDGAVSEADFQQTVIDAARLLGWRVFHSYDSRRSEAGFPDIVAVRGERLVIAELKRQGGRVRREQVEWLQALGAATPEVHLWRPSDWDEIERTLQ